MFQRFCEMFVGIFFILISPGHETNLYPKSQDERDLHQTWLTCTTSVQKITKSYDVFSNIPLV